MKLYIKNMVSPCCKIMVKAAFDKLGLHYSKINLGEVDIPNELNPEQEEQLQTVLQQSGLELVNDRKSILIEKIKAVIIEMVYEREDAPTAKNSDYISEKLHYTYPYLANIFSEETGNTIEQFIIAHKIERVKELIMYGELNLTEISYKLHYSSIAHLSNQFKKVTGLAPSRFRKQREKKRTVLDNVGMIQLSSGAVVHHRANGAETEREEQVTNPWTATEKENTADLLWSAEEKLQELDAAY